MTSNDNKHYYLHSQSPELFLWNIPKNNCNINISGFYMINLPHTKYNNKYFHKIFRFYQSNQKKISQVSSLKNKNVGKNFGREDCVT